MGKGPRRLPLGLRMGRFPPGQVPGYSEPPDTCSCRRQTWGNRGSPLPDYLTLSRLADPLFVLGINLTFWHPYDETWVARYVSEGWVGKLGKGKGNNFDVLLPGKSMNSVFWLSEGFASMRWESGGWSPILVRLNLWILPHWLPDAIYPGRKCWQLTNHERLQCNGVVRPEVGTAVSLYTNMTGYHH